MKQETDAMRVRGNESFPHAQNHSDEKSPPSGDKK